MSATFLPCHLSEDVSQQRAFLNSLINDAPKLLDDAFAPLKNDITNFSLLVDQRFCRLETRLESLEIEAMNARIRSRNRVLQTFDPVLKTVSIHFSFFLSNYVYCTGSWMWLVSRATTF